MLPFRRWRACFLLCFGAAMLLPTVAEAAYTDYGATLISVSSAKQLQPGTISTITVSVKNTGPAIWKASGTNYASLYHWDPVKKVETASPFAASSWINTKQPLRLAKDVSPGSTVTFTFQLKAPNVPGLYHEPFILTAENAAWIKQTQFVLDIQVGSAQTQATLSSAIVVASAPAQTSAQSSASAGSTVNSALWSGQIADRGGSEWQIEMDDKVSVEVAFTNTGSQTWTRDGVNYVSLYAVDQTQNKERTSLFQDTRWLSPSHPVALTEASVPTGQIGHFRFDIRAPKTAGAYKETFMLAAEGKAWIDGTRLTLPIDVPARGEFIGTAPTDDMTTNAPVPTTASTPSVLPVVNTRPAGQYSALLLLRSSSSLVLSGNGRQQLTFGFKNEGTSSWSSYGIVFSSLSPTRTGKGYSVRDDAWTDATRVTSVTGATKPGEIGFVTFYVKAPSYKGSYVATFQLIADNGAVENGSFNIPIQVTQDGYVEPDVVVPSMSTPSTPSIGSIYNAIPLTGDVNTLPDEPIIRVGLFKTTDDQMIIRAKDVPITVSQNGTTICHVNTGETATVHYDRTQSVYSLSGSSCSGQSRDVYLFRTDDSSSPMEIADFQRPLSWLPGANDNTFRAQLELRYTPATNNVWVINTLPIESYLKGIAETSNSSPPEFQKTLLTAARTYAMYHVEHATKHANENYIVDATYDQVYRGYGAESRDPTIVAAVDATRGQIVTYQGKLALTPYYSRSDGRTRSWGEVWYGQSQYPWLVSVPVPWDQGKTLWGHGVGLSASGALGMAGDGKSYDQILKYFYTGVDIERAYK